MNLIRTSSYTLFATIVKMFSSLVINKAIAYFVGPSGLALIGQFQNFSQLAQTLAQGGINTGVVKYTSEYGEGNKNLPILFSTALKISVYSSLITGILLISFPKLLSTHFLHTADYYYVFIIFGITIIFFSINSLLLSILNGLQEIRIFTQANIIQSIYSLIFTTSLIYFLGLHGALIALVTNQSIIIVILLLLLRKHKIIIVENFNQTFNNTEARKLFKFSLMTLISSIITPISLIIIRNRLSEKLGLDATGQWQAMWYISTMYLLVITTTLSVYYLPKLSSISDNENLRKEIYSGYKIIVPLVIVFAASIFVLKGFIIQLLFSNSFLPMKELFLFQLLGDILKIFAWLLSYLMLAKAMTKTYIITEIVFVTSFVLISFSMTDKFGIIGMSYAYSINYFIYLLCLIYIFRKLIFHKI